MFRAFTFLSCAAALLSGCGGSPSVDDLPSVTEELVATLKTIKDADGAKAAAPKLEELAEKIHALQKQSVAGNATAPSNPEQFAQKQQTALAVYGEELVRISSIPGAAQQLQGMIKKLTPDREMVASFESRAGKAMQEISPAAPHSPPPASTPAAEGTGGIQSALAKAASTAETNPKVAAREPASPPVPAAPAQATAERPDLRPDPNYKDPIADVGVNSNWSKWFPTAKKGDFVELDSDAGIRHRHEVVDVVGDSAIITTIHHTGSSKLESRVKMKVLPKSMTPPPGMQGPAAKNVGAETISVQGRELKCQVVKLGAQTTWYCDEVPFDGIVKEAQGPRVEATLIAFGRGTGPSPNIPPEAATPSSTPAPAAKIATPSSPPPAAVSAPGANEQERDRKKMEDLQASIEKCRAEIERLTPELRQSKTTTEGLEKKVKRVTIAASKSKRSKEVKGELQRELSRARDASSKLEKELKKNQDQLDKLEKQLKTLEERSSGKP